MPESLKNPLVSYTIYYLQDIVGLIEGRAVSHEEIVASFFRNLRQGSIVRRTRLDYSIEVLNAKEPSG